MSNKEDVGLETNEDCEDCPRCSEQMAISGDKTLICHYCGKSFVRRGKNTLVEVTGGSSLQIASL